MSMPVTMFGKFVLLFAFVFAVAYGACPQNWHAHARHCFFLSKDNETFAGSEVMCQMIGKQLGRTCHLAVVGDAATDTFLFNLIDKAKPDLGYYIGINDIVEEGTWVWSYAKNITAGYLNWGKDQPNNRWETENCAVMRGSSYSFAGLNHTWTDDPCTDLNNYICMTTQNIGLNHGVFG